MKVDPLSGLFEVRGTLTYILLGSKIAVTQVSPNKILNAQVSPGKGKAQETTTTMEFVEEGE